MTPEYALATAVLRLARADLQSPVGGSSSMNLIPHPSDGWLPFLEVFPDAEDFYPATVHCGGETVTLRELFIAPRALERLLKLGVRG